MRRLLDRDFELCILPDLHRFVDAELRKKMRLGQLAMLIFLAWMALALLGLILAFSEGPMASRLVTLGACAWAMHWGGHWLLESVRVQWKLSRLWSRLQRTSSKAE